MKPVSVGNESGSPVPETPLGRCFVDGDAAAVKSGRRLRHKALGISFAIEATALALLLIVPLMSSIAQPTLSKPTFVPVISGVTHSPHTEPRRANTHIPVGRQVANPIWFRVGGVTPRQPLRRVEVSGGDRIDDGEELGQLQGELHTIAIEDLGMKAPSPPSTEVNKHEPKRRVKMNEGVEQAQLILRIEPRYPQLAIQVKKEGTVILHAIISREGSITALDVLSGPPLLVQAALEAVRQWRYRPTLLNGEPVEVETTITVIFRLQQ
jgi:protein TonB